jgi:superfamily I DNA and/or RNA helicase
MLDRENIYAVTCHGSQNAILSIINPFDVCIVENAESIKEPTALCSLILCKKFILAGSTEVVKAENDDSEEKEQQEPTLFHRLLGQGIDNVTQLNYTYLD